MRLHRGLRRLAPIALLLIAPAIPRAETATKSRAYPLPGHGSLELAAPSGWRVEVHDAPGEMPPTIEYSPASGDAFSLQVTPLWSPKADPEFTRPESIRALLATIGSRQLPQAVETEIKLEEIKGPRAMGYMFTISDRAPKEGEWKYMTMGAVGLGDLLVSFTLLTQSLDSPERKAALKMIELALPVAPASAAPAPSPSATAPADAPSPRPSAPPRR